MESYFLDISIIVVCSAILAWLAAFCRQPIILGYFLCGVLIGPWGLAFVPHTELVEELSHIGIALLLFLAGLELHPDRLVKVYRSAIILTVGGCVASWLATFLFFFAWGYGAPESAIAGLALMFSSTILVVKLLPTDTLHDRRMGTLCVAILIAQDIIAVVLITLLTVPGGGSPGHILWSLLIVLGKTAMVVLVAGVAEQFLLRRVFQSENRLVEMDGILSLGWCLGVAVLSKYVGLSYEVGAFIAGVVLARSRQSETLAEALTPLRDFFLMLFFFVLGAELDLFLAGTNWLPALLLGIIVLAGRPLWVAFLFRRVGEDRRLSAEAGVRLGQTSEFSLLVAIAAAESGKLSLETSQLIQLCTILTIMVSSYIVVQKYSTPLSRQAQPRTE